MPTETFFNLPQEKKEKIIEAIKSELARVPLEEASINRIVQNANISRGSFYMYFRDKKDMVNYILTTFQEQLSCTLRESFERNNGDMFSVFIDILQFIAEFGTTQEHLAISMNIFAYQRIHNNLLQDLVLRSRQQHFIDVFREKVNTDNLDIQGPNDLTHMIDILKCVTQKAIVDIFIKPDRKEQILDEFKNKIVILKRGLSKENVKC
jgi:AcrR family transcriptional regulator